MAAHALDCPPAAVPLTPPAFVEEFYIPGEPVRALYADEGSLRRRAGGGPRSARVREHVDPRQWCLPGVYLLLDPCDGDGVTKVYVGSTHDLLDRFEDHEREGWVSAVALTGHGLTEGYARQFERGLGKVLRAADPDGRKLVPAWVRHPGQSRGDTSFALTPPLVILAERTLRRVGALELRLDPEKAFLP